MRTYRLRFTTAKTDNKVQFTESVDATDPISALGCFHKNRQLFLDKIKPEEYTIVSMHQFYNGVASGTMMVESEVDLPKCKNPDFSYRAQHTNDTAELPMAIETGRLAE